MLDSDGGLGRSEAAAVTLLLIEDDPGGTLSSSRRWRRTHDRIRHHVARSLDEARTRLGESCPTASCWT